MRAHTVENENLPRKMVRVPWRHNVHPRQGRVVPSDTGALDRCASGVTWELDAGELSCLIVDARFSITVHTILQVDKNALLATVDWCAPA